MARTTASKRPFFPLLGEPLALDLVNTVIRGPATAPATVDLISQPHRWGQWLDYQWPRLEPIVDAPLTAHLRSPECLHRVRELRDAARVVINAARTFQPSEAAHTTNDTAISRVAVATALSAPTSTGNLDRHLHRALFDIEALLGALVMATIDLANGPDRIVVRECQAPDCDLLFVPRHPTRRWCSRRRFGRGRAGAGHTAGWFAGREMPGEIRHIAQAGPGVQGEGDGGVAQRVRRQRGPVPARAARTR